MLKCKNCQVDSTYAEIPDDTENYFLPQRPKAPEGFTFTCPSCGHGDTYQSYNLSYRRRESAWGTSG